MKSCPFERKMHWLVSSLMSCHVFLLMWWSSNGQFCNFHIEDVKKRPIDWNSMAVPSFPAGVMEAVSMVTFANQPCNAKPHLTNCSGHQCAQCSLALRTCRDAVCKREVFATTAWSTFPPTDLTAFLRWLKFDSEFKFHYQMSKIPISDVQWWCSVSGMLNYSPKNTNYIADGLYLFSFRILVYWRQPIVSLLYEHLSSTRCTSQKYWCTSPPPSCGQVTRTGKCIPFVHLIHQLLPSFWLDFQLLP